MQHYDVAVLGAGAAGLAAAVSLARAGQRVVVIEARERIGGRIFTRSVQTPGGQTFPVELGAEFIHGLPPETWTLIGEAGLETSESSGKLLEFSGGELRAAGEGSFHVLEQMKDWWSRQPLGHDATFAEYLAIAGLERGSAERASAFVEGFNAADRNVISVAALARQQLAEDDIEGDRAFRVRSGYAALPAFLAKRVADAGGELLLSSQVTHVTWRPGEVVLSGVAQANRAFEIHAKRCVVTLPLGVLQSGSVQFDPLPLPVSIADRLAMGMARRITLQFSQRFWLDAVARVAPAHTAPNGNDGHMSFLFARGELFPTWWTPEPQMWPLITAWVGGPKAANLPDALTEHCIDTLASVFRRSPAEIGGMLEEAHTHDWLSDPLALGAYSYVPSGAIAASQAMAQVVSDTLCFAGEHTDTTGHWGTVHAALRSGFVAGARLGGIGLEYRIPGAL